jgi:enoyl-CoA hydratase
MSDSDDIQFDARGAIRLVTLNRPKVLNALTLEMFRAFHPRLKAWAEDPEVAAVVIRGAGEKAFCAGGDLLHIYHGREDGRNPFGEALFREEYRLNRLIKNYPKPYIALLDGVTMGGGVGVSIHGSHRVASERCLFAMPEAAIGLYPDVGGSYFLPRLPGEMGLFIGLTGWRLKAGDCCHLGLATHQVPSSAEAALLDALAGAPWQGGAAAAVVEGVLASFAIAPAASDLAAWRAGIDRCFGANSPAEIMTALGAEDADWAAKAHSMMARASPTSLWLTFEQIRRGAGLDFDGAMAMEYRLSLACLRGHDFYEGIRAVVVEKDQRPRWQPADLDAIKSAVIEQAFASLGEAELTFDDAE